MQIEPGASEPPEAAAPTAPAAAAAPAAALTVAGARGSELGAAVRRGLLAAAAMLLLAWPLPRPREGPPAPLASAPAVASAAVASSRNARIANGADFGGAQPAADVRQLADWIAASQDNAGLSFVILDKRGATLLVFDPQARLVASSAVLLGLALGDDSVPDIGERPVPLVLPHERTTPAGRFLAERGRNAQGEDVIWVDHGAAVSMHRVRSTDPSERRAERLATPSAEDNRISYGCINVPVAFYDSHIQPLFAQRPALVYVMPELKPMRAVFGMPPHPPPSPALIVRSE